MKLWVPGTEDPTLDGLPLTRSGLYISCAYPGGKFGHAFGGVKPQGGGTANERGT